MKRYIKTLSGLTSRYTHKFAFVSLLFIVFSTLFDVIFWGIFDYRYRFLNPVYYELFFTMGWTFIPMILSQKLSDYRISYICTGYYLFNIEDLFLSHTLWQGTCRL